MQKRVMDNIIPIHNDSSYAFKKGSSILNMIKDIIKNKPKKILTIDIKNFFSSITDKILLNFFNEDQVKIMTKDGVLPQGGITSPIASEYVMSPLDTLIVKMTPNCKYYRYADDIIITAEEEYLEDALNNIKKVLKTYGLQINDNKTTITSLNQETTICGVKVVTNRLGKVTYTLGNKYYKNIQNQIHYINKRLDAGQDVPEVLIQRVLGKLN
jgi:retron-type reverse transcriptase